MCSPTSSSVRKYSQFPLQTSLNSLTHKKSSRQVVHGRLSRCSHRQQLFRTFLTNHFLYPELESSRSHSYTLGPSFPPKYTPAPSIVFPSVASPMTCILETEGGAAVSKTTSEIQFARTRSTLSAHLRTSLDEICRCMQRLSSCSRLCHWGIHEYKVGTNIIHSQLVLIVIST